MNEQYVEERIKQYSKTRIFYEEYAEQVLNILKAIVKQDYPGIKIASYSKRAKAVESLRKKLRKDKYNKESEITDLAGVRIITYRQEIEKGCLKYPINSMSLERFMAWKFPNFRVLLRAFYICESVNICSWKRGKNLMDK